MARLRRVQQEPEPIDDERPDWLDAPVVEDFVAPSHRERHWPPGAPDVTEFLFVARRRWHAARIAWAAENGVPRCEVIGFSTMPTFHDRSKFEAAVRDAHASNVT